VLLLAIETSSARGSLALLEGRQVVARSFFPEGLVHGREVTARLDSMLASRGVPPGRLEAIAVGLGPGSYTGIRVGVTAAKTLAFALRIPVIPESSLRVIAANLRGAAGTLRVVPAVDGKQRQIYVARFRVESGPGGPRVVREIDDRVVEAPRPAGRAGSSAPAAPPASLIEVLAPGAVVLGDAADAVLESAGAAGAVRGPLEHDRPLADALGELAAEAAERDPPRFDLEAVHRLSPIYLRPSEAERKLDAARTEGR
jgi:tRNA threonylcarbamoyladenosine biosynthesis protein TsaB